MVHLRQNYTKNLDLKQWRRRGGFEDFVVSIKFCIIKHQLFFTFYFPYQIGIKVHVTIPKLGRFSAENKLLVILFCLRHLENRTNLTPPSVKLLHVQYFTNHFQTLSDWLQITLLELMMFLILTRLSVDFSHFREHKLKHIFQDTLNLLCPFTLEAEDTYHVREEKRIHQI